MTASTNLIKFSSDDKKALWLTLVVFLSYVVYSFLAPGFYQHDEIGHYFNMREFWNNPNVILGNSAKTGYKLIYVIPSLLGNKFLVYVNAAFAAMACFLTYKVAERIGSKFAWLAFFMLALQPYWIQLSFRNYADTFSGFILLLALYFHSEKKYVASSLILSFAGIIRQEFLLLIPIYGIWQALNKRWICFLLLGAFPLLNNIWGFMATGEPLYLITSSSKTAAKYADEWPRQGFDHYFKMGITIWGAVQCFFLVMYILLFFAKRAKMFNQTDYTKEYPQQKETAHSLLFISIPVLVYFFIHCLFNWESLKIGAATGGNLRYMTAISPLVALLCAIVCDKYKHLNKKTLVYVGITIYVIVVTAFLCYPNNNVRLLNEVNPQTGEEPAHDYIPLLFTLSAAACLFIISKQKQLTIAFTIIALLFVLFTVRPFKATPEDTVMETITNSIIAKGFTDKQIPVYTNHILFKYFYDKKKHNVYNKQVYSDSLSLQTAPVGSIVLWESHYGYRPKLNKNTVNADYFQRRPQQYTLLQSRISTDQRFQALVFEKIAP
ncbi:MAG TPA: hypothetical protein VK835_14875 [Bacteroidia bacterium]|jgi:hypothetical protein|nr:hypothetical protein [Bacteroidia bacterium]